MNAENSKTSSLKIVVKAKALFEAKWDKENQEQIIDTCIALIDGDGLGSPFGSKNKDQTTVVYLGYEMKWSIELAEKYGEDKGYTVVLDSIKQGSPGDFIKTPIKTNAEGVLVGHVSTNKDHVGKDEHYTINFHISKGLVETDILPIDPRLKMKDVIKN